METQTPRLVLAGTGSGCGKTTVTCALLQALTDRGYRAAAFKCGPDYIDPMFHRRIIGAKSANLDLFFFHQDTLRYLLQKNAAGRDISIIEGVMGYYDGMSVADSQCSTHAVAQATESPTVLVVGARGCALSALAVIQGFDSFYPDSRIAGVILNQCSATTYEALAGAIKERFGGRIRPLGYLPNLPGCVLESRHLGLVTAAEVDGLKEKMKALAAQAEKTLDLDGLMSIAGLAPPLHTRAPAIPRFDEPVRIAVAQDRAFCFYYEDNLELLQEMGAELVPFSPLEDSELPPGIHGLYLGGGYPELYADQLSQNAGMRSSVFRALSNQLPCIAECGGFMYLTAAIAGWPMVGFLPGQCHDTGRLTRFGYVTLCAQHDCMLCSAGEKIAGHEFHRWDCDCPGDAFTALRPNGRSWRCAVAGPFLYAGFPHFHFYANPGFAAGFYHACAKEKHRHD